MSLEQYNIRIAYIDKQPTECQAELLKRVKDRGFWVYAKSIAKESSSSLNASKE